jgi:hypothetical protein
MDAKTDAPSTPAPAEVSLVRGGPFYRAEQAMGLIRPDRWNLGRRIAALIAISWLPLLLVTAFLILPNTCSPLARTLKLNGYATAQFGKCHEVPVWQTSPAGPFDAWPTGGGGFEYFYGFIGGEAHQW